MQENHRIRLAEMRRAETEDKSRCWKGHRAGYVAKHTWARKYLIKKDYCEYCKKQKSQVSRLEFANISKQYYRKSSDWITLCPSCHRKKDKGNCCKYGHNYTPENTYIRKEGWRICKICQKERHKKWKNAS